VGVSDVLHDKERVTALTENDKEEDEEGQRALNNQERIGGQRENNADNSYAFGSVFVRSLQKGRSVVWLKKGDHDKHTHPAKGEAWATAGFS
jgi:hypothetical protein